MTKDTHRALSAPLEVPQGCSGIPALIGNHGELRKRGLHATLWYNPLLRNTKAHEDHKALNLPCFPSNQLGSLRSLPWKKPWERPWLPRSLPRNSLVLPRGVSFVLSKRLSQDTPKGYLGGAV